MMVIVGLHLSAGVRPSTHLAKDAGLELGAHGGIVVDSHLRTSDPHIWGAGDSVETPNTVLPGSGLAPLAGPANREARVAAENICGRSTEYKSTQGTSIVKVFDMVAGGTGATERQLIAAGVDYRAVHVHPSGHAGYYPGTAMMNMKLLFAPDTGRILGGQVAGFDGVDKRLDVLATALRAELTVWDLEDLELAYAPPFGFEEFARSLPPAVHSPVHRQSRRYFRLGTPAVDPAAILARLGRHLAAGKGLDVDSFTRRIDAIRARLAADPATAGLLTGLAVPLIVPRTPVTEIGTLMEEGYLPAVARSFEEAFPAERFTNHVKLGLAGKLTVQPGSRHERLIEAMGDDEVVGLYFPCLTEYSLPAAVEQIASLPDHLLLAGGFDTAAAFVGVPDLLLRTDGYPPPLWLTGLAGEKPGIGYHFEAYGHDLTFNRRAHLGQTAEYWWSGISVLETR